MSSDYIKMEGGINMNVKKYGEIWYLIGDLPRLNGNGYRLLNHLLFEGASTQIQISETRAWKFSSVSNTMRRLYEMGLVECFAKDKKFVYSFNYCWANENLDKALPVVNGELEINKELNDNLLRKIIYKVSDISQMTANCYRVYGDVLMYGPTTRKEVYERREWKIAGVNQSFQKLIDWGLLECEKENGKDTYSAKLSVD